MAEQRLEQMGIVHRDLLRYLLIHQPVDRRRLRVVSNLPENEFDHCLTVVSQSDLTEFHQDGTIQRWRVREQFVPVLKDLLFPRGEGTVQGNFLP